ncbi:hypothetical protein ACA910_009627 [Epithemia clementina (nom. ined.)]
MTQSSNRWSSDKAQRQQQQDTTTEAGFCSSSDEDSMERRGQREEEDMEQTSSIEVPYKEKSHAASSQQQPQQVHVLRSIARSKKGRTGFCCGFLVVVGVILVVVFVVVLGGDPNNIPASWNEIFDTDPFEGVPPEEAIRWGTSGSGLSIQVVNALDERWYPYFEKSMTDWDSGYPDALELSTSSRAPEFDCLHESGIIKVCNGNYGETPWKGRAEILSDGLSDTIFAVTARLNEYYLSSRNTNEMQYAMCHELGHTFGLHHTDENFYNRDLGNCLDYTNRHANNLTPDSSNFQYLHAMYGLAPGAAPYNAPTPAPVPTTAPPSPTSVFNQGSNPTGGSGGSGNTGNGGGGSGSGNTGNGGFTTTNQQQPSQTQDENQEEEDNNNEENDKKEKDNRKLNELPDWLLDAIQEAREQELHGESHSIPLPGGYVLHIHQYKA